MLFITHSSKLHFLMAIFLSKMLDVVDLLVLTFSNTVLKSE